jgi:hypothetical protein
LTNTWQTNMSQHFVTAVLINMFVLLWIFQTLQPIHTAPIHYRFFDIALCSWQKQVRSFEEGSLNAVPVLWSRHVWLSWSKTCQSSLFIFEIHHWQLNNVSCVKSKIEVRIIVAWSTSFFTFHLNNYILIYVYVSSLLYFYRRIDWYNDILRLYSWSKELESRLGYILSLLMFFVVSSVQAKTEKIT